jgi:hypothetical protein
MLHLPVAQSRSLRQPWTIEHRFSQVVPPQSTPVSVPSAPATTARGPCLSRRRRRRLAGVANAALTRRAVAAGRTDLVDHALGFAYLPTVGRAAAVHVRLRAVRHAVLAGRADAALALPARAVGFVRADAAARAALAVRAAAVNVGLRSILGAVAVGGALEVGGRRRGAALRARAVAVLGALLLGARLGARAGVAGATALLAAAVHVRLEEGLDGVRAGLVRRQRAAEVGDAVASGAVAVRGAGHADRAGGRAGRAAAVRAGLYAVLDAVRAGGALVGLALRARAVEFAVEDARFGAVGDAVEAGRADAVLAVAVVHAVARCAARQIWPRRPRTARRCGRRSPPRSRRCSARRPRS